MNNSALKSIQNQHWKVHQYKSCEHITACPLVIFILADINQINIFLTFRPNRQKGNVVLNVHNFCPNRKTQSHNGHVNWRVLQPQQTPGIYKAVCYRIYELTLFLLQFLYVHLWSKYSWYDLGRPLGNLDCLLYH